MTALRRVFFRALHAEELPETFWLLWAGAFLNKLGGFVVPFLALYLTEQRGVSTERAGLMLSVYGLGNVGASLAGGALADRIGRRATMVGALSLSALAMLQLGTARGDGHLLGSVLALGFFGELYRPALQAMVADLVPEGAPRAAAFGALYWAANLGFACSAALAGLLAGYDFRLLFLGDALTTLGFAAVTLLRLPETRPAAVRAAGSRRNLLAPFADRAFVAMLAANALVAFCFFQVNSTLPVAMRAEGLSAREFGLLLALNGVLIVLLQPAAARWAGRLPARRVMAGGALLIGLGFASHAAATTAASWALAITVWTLGEIVLAPRTSAVVADLAPAHLRGSYQGALVFSFGAGAALGPTAGGWLLAQHGPSGLWLACGLAGLTAAALLARGAGRERR